MAYVVKLASRARAELADYIASFSDDPSLQQGVADNIEAGLQRLAANPKFGTTPRHPLGRPTFIIKFQVDDVVRYVKIVYRYEESEEAIEVFTVQNVKF